jgi:hypothetical protein
VNCIARTLEIELKPWDIPNIMIRCGGIKTAAGLRTTGEVAALFAAAPPERLELYRPALSRWGEDMAAFDEKRAEPAAVAALVLKALEARHPRRRYSIGHMAGMAAVLEALPQPLADAVLKLRF